MSEKEKPLIDVTKMSVSEIVHLIANDPEIIERLAIAKAEQDRREAERLQREKQEREEKYRLKIAPFIGAVILDIKQISDSDYDYNGETVVHTSKGEMVFDGTIQRASV